MTMGTQIDMFRHKNNFNTSLTDIGRDNINEAIFISCIHSGSTREGKKITGRGRRPLALLFTFTSLASDLASLLNFIVP